VVQNLKPEKDDKCRCCYVTCNKLFKGADFLSKHMRLKHEDFAADLLLKDAEPFMRRRFEAEPMGARPLPPVEVEAHGRTELKSVKAILDKFMPQVAVGAVGGHRREDAAGARRASGGEGRRGQDERDRRGAGPGQGGSSGAPVRQQVQYVEPKPEDNHSRKISSYIDVDAPKVKSACMCLVLWCCCELLSVCACVCAANPPQFKSKYRTARSAPPRGCRRKQRTITARYLLQMW
jgi:hypothetical protein